MNFNGTEGDIDTADYVVIDIYAQSNDVQTDGFPHTSSTLLSSFDSDISMSDGRHFNHVETAGGSWNPQFSLDLPSAGSRPWVDSFVLIGGTPGDLNNTMLNPEFDLSTGGQVPTGGGWYTGSPAALQGRVDEALRTWVGRFAIPNNDAIGESITFSATISYNYGLGTYFSGNSSITPTIPVPEPSALWSIGVSWAGFATIRNRFFGEPNCPRSLVARRRPRSRVVSPNKCNVG